MVALAFGKPIVVSRVGGFAETIRDGVHGFLVELGDAELFAHALARVLSNDELRIYVEKAMQKLVSGEFC